MFYNILHQLFPFISESLLIWVWLMADICTILWFLWTIIFQNKKIQNLQQQIIQVNNQNNLEYVQTQIKWISEEQMNNLLDRYNECSKKLYDETSKNINLIHKEIENQAKKIAKAQYIDIDHEKWAMIIKNVNE